MKKIIFILLSIVTFDLHAAWSPEPCALDGNGLVTNVGGENGGFACDVKAEEVKLKLYKLALCTQRPRYSATVAPDLSSCKFIVDNSSPTDIVVSQTSGFNLTNVPEPPSGTYPYLFVLLSNNVIVKSKVHFSSPKTTTFGTSTGEWCWTNGSLIERILPASSFPQPQGNGLTCGASVGSDYDFNTIFWAEKNTGSAWSEGSEDVPDGINHDAFLNDNLLGVFEMDTTRWAISHEFNTPVTITDSTQALEMSMNLSTGVTVFFDQAAPSKIRQLEDGPFGFIVRPINQ
jgi:hypothetical protein